jgi:hypothetical protein
MKARLQDAYDRAHKLHQTTEHSRVIYNECFESSINDSYAARYFERLNRNETENNVPVGEVQR